MTEPLSREETMLAAGYAFLLTSALLQHDRDTVREVAQEVRQNPGVRGEAGELLWFLAGGCDDCGHGTRTCHGDFVDRTNPPDSEAC